MLRFASRRTLLLLVTAAAPVWAGPLPRPVDFERNVGQGPEGAAAFARGAGWRFVVWPDRMRFDVEAGGRRETTTVRVEGADARARPIFARPPVRSTVYLRGRDAEARRLAAPHYDELRFAEVYPGLDLVYRVVDGEPEYDFVVAPGADIRRIVLRFDRPMRLDAEGRLSLAVAGRELLHRAPELYQEIDGERRAVGGRFVALDERRVGFEADGYDPARPLVVDPRVGLRSFFGGAGADRIHAAVFDARGDLWLAGESDAADFPLPSGVFAPPRRGDADAFVAKLVRSFDSAGRSSWRLATTVFLGGSGRDRAMGVGLDAAGRLYVVGDTRSRDFPVSNDGFQRDLAGGTDVFVAVLRETDFPLFQLTEEAAERPSQLGFTNYEIEFSTLIGGAGEDLALRGFTANFDEDAANPCVAVAGQTDSAAYPTTLFSAQERRGGGTDAFFSYLCRRASGPSRYPLVYSTYFGGSRDEAGAAAAAHPSGSFCLATRTVSGELPATGVQRGLAGGSDAYIGCFAPVRRRIGLPYLYRETGRTFYGGADADTIVDLALRPTGPGEEDFRLYALFESNSTNIPASAVTPPEGASAGNPGGRSLLVAGFEPALGAPEWQFWIGGGAAESAGALALRSECFAVAGRTASADFPSTAGFPRRPIVPSEDLVAAKYCLEPNGRLRTVYSGAFGSSWDDHGAAVALGPDDNEVYAGWTTARAVPADPDFPATPGAPQAGRGGGPQDGLLIELFRPRLRADAVVGAADFRAAPLAPGRIVSLFGVGFGPSSPLAAQLDAAGRLPTALGGVRVLFDGVAAPLLFVSRGQINAIAPFFLDSRASTSIRVEVDGAASEPVVLATAAAAPGVFTSDRTGSGQAAALNENASINGLANPAPAGSVVVFFLTGAGQTEPRGVDGELVPVRPPFPRIAAPVVVRIGGVQANVLYDGAAPGLLHGVAQINAVVPRGLPTNPRTAVEITIGGRATQPGVTIAVTAAP